MKTLRSLYFHPQTGAIDLYLSEDGFNRTQPETRASLSPQMQAVADGALQWLAAQLPAGLQTLTQVIVARKPDVVATWTPADDTANPPTQATPLTFSPVFEISATGAGVKGETTIGLTTDPSPATTAFGLLWDYLLAAT